MAKTVQMERDGKTADVHTAEVEEMAAHGWRVVDPKRKTPAKRKG